MKKRILSALLVLCLVLSMAVPVWAVEESIATPKAMNTIASDITWEYNTLSGERITNTTFQGKIQVLVYFSIAGDCINSNRTIQSLASSDWIKRDDVQVVAMAGAGISSTGEIVKPTQKNVQSYAEIYASNCNDILFAWDDNGSISAAYSYLKRANVLAEDATSLTTYAANVILDKDNCICSAWMGGYEELRYQIALGLIDDTGIFSTYQASIEGTSDYQAAYEMLEILNNYREQQGRTLLTMDKELLNTAMQRAAEISVYYSHTRPDGSDCFTAFPTAYKSGGRENIAAGQPNVNSVMSDWIASSGHNANILATGNQSVGIGCFTQNGRKFWVQVFSSKSGVTESVITTGQKVEVYSLTACRAFVGLDELMPIPNSATISIGQSRSFALEGENQGYRSTYMLMPSVASIEDTDVATVELSETGAVVTAVGGGNTVLKLGVKSTESGKAPLTVEVPITVTATPLAKSMFTVDTSNATYTGSALEKQVSGQDGDKTLVLGKDYTVSYNNNINAGTASLTIQGKGAYSGELIYSFTIDKAEQTTLEIESRSVKFGEELVLSTMGGSGNGTVSYVITDGTDIAAIRNGKLIPKGVGTVTVKATKAGDTNYNETSKTQEITITKGTIPSGFISYTTISCSYQTQIGTYSIANLLNDLNLGANLQFTAQIQDAGGILQADGVNINENAVLEYTLLDNLERPDGEKAPTASIAIEVDSTNYERFSIELIVELSSKAIQVAPTAADFDLILAPDWENNRYIATIDSKLENLEYSFDGGKTWGMANEKTDVIPGETVSATIRYRETDEAIVSDAAPINRLVAPLPKVSTPTSTPSSGTAFTSSLEIALACDTEGAKIYYTVDGSIPAEGVVGSIEYQDNIRITATTTIKAIAVKDGMADSDMLTVVFTKETSSISGGGGGISIGGGGGITGGTTTKPTTPTTPTQSTTPSQPSTPPANTIKEFTDVPAGEYYAQAVAWAVDKGITNGLTETAFGPDASCTRAQMVTFLWRAAGCPEPVATTTGFADVDSNGYYYKAMLWAVEKGITNGTTDATFSPDAIVTRAQTVTFLYRYAGCPAAEGESSFADLQTGAYYGDAVQWAVDSNITNGTSETTFSPADNCTRGQIVTFLYRQMAN